MNSQVYYTNDNKIKNIKSLSFNKKKLLVIYTINGKKYITTTKYKEFNVNVSMYSIL
jgi:hypothetical protein